MKRLLLAVLFILTMLSISSAELTVAWNSVFEDIEYPRVTGIETLANGSYIVFYHQFVDDGHQQSYLIIDIDGNILNHVINYGIGNVWPTNIVSTSDGGVLLCLFQDGNIRKFYKWNSQGDMNLEHTIVAEVYQHCMIETPDDKLILGGYYDNYYPGSLLYCLDNNYELLWRRNIGTLYDEQYQSTDVLKRNYDGIYKAFIFKYDPNYNSRNLLASFSSNGYIYSVVDMGIVSYQQFKNASIAICQYENTFVQLTDEPYASPDIFSKHGVWELELPRDPYGDLVNSSFYYGIDYFQGLSGYACLGYSNASGQFHRAAIYEVSENGALVDTLVSDSTVYEFSTRGLDGSIVYASKNYGGTPGPTTLQLLCVQKEVTHLPVSLQMWLLNAPIAIPASGGPLNYRALIGNGLNQTTPIDFQLRLIKPDGTEEIMRETTLVLQPNVPINYPHLQLQIPEHFPAGEYTLYAEAFDGLGTRIAVSHETFSKAGFENLAAAENGEIASDLPQHFTLSHPYPNPFNAETRISLTLPQQSELTIVVYDIQGRVVAALATDETRAAGTHDFTLNGIDLASGLYFVQATVPGKMNEIRKLVLVK